MPYDPKRHCRRSIRLHGYDYAAPGAYFVTICTQDNAYLFGNVAEGRMQLNDYGQIVRDIWHGLPRHYPHIILDAFVVMPNHVHGIIVITADGYDTTTGANVPGTTAGGLNEPNVPGTTTVGAGFKPAPTFPGLPPLIIPPAPPTPIPTTGAVVSTSQTKRHRLPEIVRGFKTLSARRINTLRGMTGTPVWQRNYWERIIRTRREWHNVRRYIAENPARWHRDRNRGD